MTFSLWSHFVGSFGFIPSRQSHFCSIPTNVPIKFIFRPKISVFRILYFSFKYSLPVHTYSHSFQQKYQVLLVSKLVKLPSSIILQVKIRVLALCTVGKYFTFKFLTSWLLLTLPNRCPHFFCFIPVFFLKF